MKFGPIAIGDAAGAILAHTQKAGSKIFKKGRTLSDDDVATMAAAGLKTVVVARLEAGDIAEDSAATRVARAVAGAGLSTTAAFTGRCNLVAEIPGVVVYEKANVDALNLIDEGITLATLPTYDVVRPRQMVGTVKVIPFAVPEAHVAACEEQARQAESILRIAHFRRRPVALIQTRIAGGKETVLNKTTDVTRSRLAALGNDLDSEDRCPHEVAALTGAIKHQRTEGAELILINGASAIVDRRDVIPAAIEQAGGQVVHFGMPVDPGNLILLGKIDDFPVLGLPGCARSPKLNGFDWVLARLLADIPVGGNMVMRMGAGGLLVEIPSRPLPRADATSTAKTAPSLPHIAAIVLAAGQSRRMGHINKLLADIDGEPMVRRTVDAVLDSRANPVIVVTGHEAARVRAVLRDRDVRIVNSPHYDTGLSASLRAGLAAVPPDHDGALIVLGDMPLVPAAHLDKLIAAFNPLEGRAICVPTWNGKRGNPVLWARRFFADMASVSGDVGARHLIGENADVVAEVPMQDSNVLVDIDSPAALASITNRETG